ncbi:cytochrome C biogenesis protein [Candidatus Woesearchaeota archaeon]|nr:cytochrome C biogenesis protein [Candidatus Woesearchaeota archaeon]
MAELGIVVAFVAGLLSFLSPCVLPLIPAFFSYMSGVSSNSSKGLDRNEQLSVFVSTAFFVLGFSMVFSVLGVLINSVFSFVAYDIKVWVGRLGGVVIIVFALYLLKVVRLPFLDAERRLFRPKAFRSHYLTSFIFGATFAAGWTPCVGAILGSIFTFAVTSPGSAFYLLLAYSVGLGAPFLLVGLFTSRFYALLARYQWLLAYFNVFAGLLLLVVGVLVFTGRLGVLAGLSPLSDFLIGWGA